MIVIVKDSDGEVIAEYDVGAASSPGEALAKAELLRVQRVTAERRRREGLSN